MRLWEIVEDPLDTAAEKLYNSKSIEVVKIWRLVSSQYLDREDAVHYYNLADRYIDENSDSEGQLQQSLQMAIEIIHILHNQVVMESRPCSSKIVV